MPSYFVNYRVICRRECCYCMMLYFGHGSYSENAKQTSSSITLEHCQLRYITAFTRADNRPYPEDRWIQHCHPIYTQGIPLKILYVFLICSKLSQRSHLISLPKQYSADNDVSRRVIFSVLFLTSEWSRHKINIAKIDTLYYTFLSRVPFCFQ